jgi:hypothetical protein
MALDLSSLNTILQHKPTLSTGADYGMGKTEGQIVKNSSAR